MTAPIDDGVRRCETCPTKTRADGFPANTCDHFHVVCEECRPGDCLECALMLGLADGWDVA